MISEQYLLTLKKARRDFINHTGHPEQHVRPEVLASWERSRAYGISAEQANATILTKDEINERIAKNQTLFDLTASFIDYLYNIVKDSGFMLLYADQDGYILKIIGDEDIVQTGKNQDLPLTVGSCRLESVLGTNAIGTPLATGKPIQLFSYEHYFELSSNWTCSGAPIIYNGKILGVICISGIWDKVHPHTLGMVMSAAEAISRQLELTESNRALTNLRNQLQTTLDSLHSGTLLLDEDYRVSFVNAITLKNLGYTEANMLGRTYRMFLPQLDLTNISENIYDMETLITGKKASFPCFITIKKVKTTAFSNRESFLISFRKKEYITNLVNRVIGSDAHFTFDHIIGSCPAILTAKHMAATVAHSNTNVLITGESGTGKELFAQSIHNESFFAKGPFVAINCGAIPKDLIESELFGYEAGSFTGAKKEGRAGKFELANNGTIFLDEIGDMPYDVQVRLLRVLQERCVTRIGGKKSIPLNVRVIAATNRNLEADMEARTFRSDLYYRLNVFGLQIPPLRARGEDVLLLAEYFLQKYRSDAAEAISEITPETKALLMHYSWPGNIRELENAMERACILTENGVLTPDKLPDRIQSAGSVRASVTKQEADSVLRSPSEPVWPHPATDTPEQQIFPHSYTGDGITPPNWNASGGPSGTDSHPTSLKLSGEDEKTLILNSIRQAHGNMKKAAELLGISRRTLYRKMDKYGIVPAAVRKQ